MDKYILLFVLQILNANALEDVVGKIVGGNATAIELYPYTVRFFNRDFFCSGSIIHSWIVMTAAHCFVNTDVDDMMIGVGSSFLQDYTSKSYDVESYVIHENYSKPILFANDIALIFITKPFKFSPNVQKGIICPNMEWANKGIDNIVVMGWGWTQQKNSELQGTLSQAALTYVPRDTCEKLHNMEFIEEMFCLYGDGKRDTCQGDSGGAVEWQGFIIGITSHGHGCAIKDKPSVYTNVWYYRQWIDVQIDKLIEKYCEKKKKKKKKKKNNV